MNIARFLLNNRVQWGIVEGDEVREIQGNLYAGARVGNRLCSLSDVQLLAPIDPQANKVPAIAANYGVKDQRDGPGLFMKPPGAIIGPNEPIIYPRIGRSIVHEAEVGIVIGRRARHVSRFRSDGLRVGLTLASTT
jgi:2-keto-4-pentenoate hydratase/2-oxohepta-3-ene-1,7-dioic acid hydratase in catechol pathway